MNYKTLVLTVLMAASFMNHGAQQPKAHSSSGCFSWLPCTLLGLTAVSTIKTIYHWDRYKHHQKRWLQYQETSDTNYVQYQQEKANILQRDPQAIEEKEEVWQRRITPLLNRLEEKHKETTRLGFLNKTNAHQHYENFGNMISASIFFAGLYGITKIP